MSASDSRGASARQAAAAAHKMRLIINDTRRAADLV
jgi:hypothetical protein